MTEEDKAFIDRFSALFGEDTNGEGKAEPVDMILWSKAFNATWFPSSVSLTEAQKKSVVGALMGNMHAGHVH